MIRPFSAVFDVAACAVTFKFQLAIFFKPGRWSSLIPGCSLLADR
jgi:hypothetical protein